MCDAVWRDVRHSLRSLAARPTYPLVAILTLALVAGAGGAVFAVVNATFVRALPFPDGDRLVRLYTQPPGTSAAKDRNPLHPLEFARFRRGLKNADAVEGFFGRARAIGGTDEPESVAAAQASAGALALLGRGPIVGRIWTEEEDRALARVAVLSHTLWQRRFGGDPQVLGRTLSIDREPHEIIGVMGPDFEPDYVFASELWTPLGIHEGNLPNPRSTYILTVARLRPGASLRQLDEEVRAAMVIAVAESISSHRGWTAGAIGMREFQFGTGRPALVLLLVAVAVLALLAAANLANVSLARVMSQRTELALRAALGASARDVYRLQIVESALVAGAGALGGLALAAWTAPALLALDPRLVGVVGDVGVDWRVIAVAIALSTAVATASGLLPVARELRSDVARRLNEGSGRTAGRRGDGSIALVLLAGQTALAVVLLAAGAVVLAGFARTSRINPGFDASNLVGAQVRLSAAAHPSDADRVAIVERILDSVRALPGVVDASTTLNFFIPGFAWQTTVEIENRPSLDGQPHTVHFRRVSPRYFRTMRIRQLMGRDFTPADRRDTPLVCIVSRSFADRFWPGENALERRVIRARSPVRVVGIVDDVYDVGLGQAPEATVYIPYAQNSPPTAAVSLVVRTASDPRALVAPIRRAVLSVDAAQPLDAVTTLDRFISDSLGPQRFRSTVLLVLAGLGLTIAAVGIYGLTARSVVERAREVGVRLALGARPGAVWRLIVTQAMRAVLLGVVAGVVASAGTTTLIVKVLPDVTLADPEALVAAVGALVVTALAAAAWPARRAVRIDPIVAMRAD
jgi:putative ABC transport system permease protein